MMFRSLTKRWTGRRPQGPAAPAADGRRTRRRVYLTVEALEDRYCPAPVFPGDTITGVVTLHSTDPNESGEGEPAMLTNTTGSFTFSVSAYEVPTPFQFKAAVVNDNVASRIIGADSDESVDVSIQINGKSALTINQKTALTDTGNNVNIGSNVLWVVAGGCAIGALFTGGIGGPAICAAIAGTLAGGTGLYGSGLQKQASDPPDFRFNRIAEVKAASAPHISVGNGVSRKLATALNSVLQTEVKIDNLLTALTTTENRVSAAGLANNQRALRRQLTVARKFRRQIASLMLLDVARRIKASAALRSAGFIFTGLTSDQVRNTEQTVSSSGPPASVLSAFHALGADAQTIAQLTSQFVVADINAVAQASHDPVADPSILASIRAGAAALRQG